MSANISVLAMNTVSFSNKNQRHFQGDQQMEQINWMEAQLATAEPGRKFILTNHIYMGAKLEVETKDLWQLEYIKKITIIMIKYSDKIILEVSGHDHIADIRYHRGPLPFEDAEAEHAIRHHLRRNGFSSDEV